MSRQNIWRNPKLIRILGAGGVAVMPTDTIYGIVGNALSPSTVRRICKIKKRSRDKPLINLIADWEETKKFGVDASEFKIPKYHEPTTFILSEISFRVPQNEQLRILLRQIGPLVAPSANPEALPPARNIAEAKKYFGRKVDFYLDGGEISGSPSRLVRLHKNGALSIIRK